MKSRAILIAVLVALCGHSVSGLAANVSEGQRIYRQFCIGCHGVGGQAAIPNAPNFSRGERLMQPDPMLMMSIKAGKMAMPSFNGILQDHQILDVIAYLRTLQQ